MSDAAQTEQWEIGVPCPDCGEPVLVEIARRADGARSVDVPESCDLDHLFTEAQREALGRQAEELLEVELEEAGRASDDD